ncbi:MAG TPA: protein kinase [Kofleriaceae bacterium]
MGQIIGGRYEIVRLIGRGGMGAIYEVRNTRLGRSFAMKTLIGDAASDPDVLSRFRREADVIARIKHPNIVEVVDWEALDDGSPCMILEYLQGEDLARRIRDAAPLPWPVIAKIGDQVLSALSIAHAANIIHRDLKPQNIFLAHDDSGDERAKLLDFGVSKIRDSQSLVTTDARLIGTPSYMAPEQAEGRHDDVGPATDLWAMGTILYEMATGDLAFDGTSMPAVLYKICSKEAEPITGRRPDAPIEFVELIREVLTRDLGARVSDADVFRIRLRESLSSVANVRYSDQVLAARPASTATPVSATRPTPRRKRHTGAHEKTIVNENVGSAETVQSGRFELPAPRTEDTLVPPRRRSNKLVFAIGAIAVAMIAVAIVVATSKSSPPSTPRAPVVQKLVEPAVVVPATVIDAGVSAVATDAAPIVADPPEPVRPANKRPVKREPPRLDIPRPVQAEAKPEVKSPPAKKCDKADPNYWLCINGEDR